MDDVWRLLTLCAVRIDGRSLDWSLLARCAAAGGLDQLYAGVIPEQSPAAARSRPVLHAALRDLDQYQDRVDSELQAAESVGARLYTVLDEGYPPNLRRVYDLPPFIFVRGELQPADDRAVAIVGTREASETGLSRAARMARELAGQGVTVVSGLAKGVDSAAHTSALEHDGRTIAVLGTGITRCYPAENAALSERIVDTGALVSQFWPSRPPGRDTFPRRNRVMSGISQGTVVIEASSTSGAKMQARLAAEHSKQVWLIHSLVTHQAWAQRMVADGTAREINSTHEVVNELLTEDQVRNRPGATADMQLTIDLP